MNFRNREKCNANQACRDRVGQPDHDPIEKPCAEDENNKVSPMMNDGIPRQDALCNDYPGKGGRPKKNHDGGENCLQKISVIADVQTCRVEVFSEEEPVEGWFRHYIDDGSANADNYGRFDM